MKDELKMSEVEDIISTIKDKITDAEVAIKVMWLIDEFGDGRANITHLEYLEGETIGAVYTKGGGLTEKFFHEDEYIDLVLDNLSCKIREGRDNQFHEELYKLLKIN